MDQVITTSSYGTRVTPVLPQQSYADDIKAKTLRANLSTVIFKTLTLLHGVPARAVERGRLTSNPAAGVRKPRRQRSRAVRPLPPATIERMRAWFLERGHTATRRCSPVLAYSGLRPGEALALTWGHVRECTLLVEAAVSLGEIATTKTGRSRTVWLPLADDLEQWRRHSRQPTSLR